MKKLFCLMILASFGFCLLPTLLPMEEGLVYQFYDEKTQTEMFRDSVFNESLMVLSTFDSIPFPIWMTERKSKNLTYKIGYFDPSPSQAAKWGTYMHGFRQDYFYSKLNFQMTDMGAMVVIGNQALEYKYILIRHDDSLSSEQVSMGGRTDSIWQEEVEWNKSPKYKHTFVPGLGVVKVEYDKAEWCTAPCKFPYVQDTTLLSYKMNPQYHNYYLCRIVKANGDTLFDAVRDVISPVLPNNPSDQIKGLQKGQWPIPSGFEVKRVERILTNGSSEILNYNVQNRVLYLEQVKNHNAVEWVRIVPKNGASRTLRWE
jgi:hypothetical protein